MDNQPQSLQLIECGLMQEWMSFPNALHHRVILDLFSPIKSSSRSARRGYCFFLASGSIIEHFNFEQLKLSRQLHWLLTAFSLKSITMKVLL